MPSNPNPSSEPQVTDCTNPPFVIGPDKVTDLRLLRPYFLVPLVGAGKENERAEVHKRIMDWIEREKSTVAYPWFRLSELLGQRDPGSTLEEDPNQRDRKARWLGVIVVLKDLLSEETQRALDMEHIPDQTILNELNALLPDESLLRKLRSLKILTACDLPADIKNFLSGTTRSKLDSEQEVPLETIMYELNVPGPMVRGLERDLQMLAVYDLSNVPQEIQDLSEGIRGLLQAGGKLSFEAIEKALWDLPDRESLLGTLQEQKVLDLKNLSPGIKNFLTEIAQELQQGEKFSYKKILKKLRGKMPDPVRLRDSKKGNLLDEAKLPQELKDLLAQPPRGLDWLIFNRKLLRFLFPNVLPEPPLKGQITDVYILSHGWHRNFFGAVAAYDKLMTIQSLLKHRGRLKPSRQAPPGFYNSDNPKKDAQEAKQHPTPYHPLFLTLHWHSDPGEDGWEDTSGRRDKGSFLENVARTFDRPTEETEQHKKPKERFTSVFEDIFQLFAQMSVPGPGALTDKMLDDEAIRLTKLLPDFNLKDAPTAELADKVAAAWTCYYQATPKRVLLDQKEKPGRFLGLWAALVNLVQFIVGTVGVSLLLYGLWQVVSKEEIRATITVSWEWPVFFEIMAVASAVSLALLCYAALRNMRSSTPWRSFTLFLMVAAWFFLQIVCSIWLAVYLLVTYFTGWIVNMTVLLFNMFQDWGQQGSRIASLFDERLGARDSMIPSWRARFAASPLYPYLFPRFFLAQLARFPLWLLDLGIARDNSRLNALVYSLDSYLAFWDMQFKAVVAARQAALFLDKLLEEKRAGTDLRKARVHFLGHSFGSLVVANAVRHLALDEDLVNSRFSQTKSHADSRKIHTLCLLQGAMASAWFEGEVSLVNCLDGVLACIFSRYDSANGFFYPVGNHGRLSAGYVGLCPVGDNLEPFRLPDPDRQGDEGCFASLTKPPPLQQMLEGLFRKRNDLHPGAWVVNLDASRMIYEGTIATGGGHSDIFKDDVIHLAWAVTLLAPPPCPCKPEAN